MMRIDIELAIKGQEEFFEEASALSKDFSDVYTGERRAFYHTKEDDKKTMRYLYLFFGVVCALDYVVMIK